MKFLNRRMIKPERVQRNRALVRMRRFIKYSVGNWKSPERQSAYLISNHFARLVQHFSSILHLNYRLICDWLLIEHLACRWLTVSSQAAWRMSSKSRIIVLSFFGQTCKSTTRNNGSIYWFHRFSQLTPNWSATIMINSCTVSIRPPNHISTSFVPVNRLWDTVQYSIVHWPTASIVQFTQLEYWLLTVPHSAHSWGSNQKSRTVWIK